MLNTFLMTFEQMAQVLALLAIGFLFNKGKVIPKSAEVVLSRLVTMLFVPALNLHVNMMECKIDQLGEYGILVLVGTAFCVGSTLLSYPTSRLFSKEDAYRRGVYRYALALPNTSGVGIPLMMAFFGTAGVFQFQLVQFAAGIVTYSWGIVQLQPSHGKTSFWSNLKKCLNLQFFAMVIGMILGILGAEEWMPSPVVQLTNNLGNCYVPVALLMTGYSLADYPLSSVFANVKYYLYTAWRLIAMPLIYLGILLVFKAPLMLATMIGIAYACPCGMNVVLFPAAYGEECRDGASLVLLSTIVSLVTVPLIYALVQAFFA